jgi:hypothetical protein
MTVFQLSLANLVMWTRDRSFPATSVVFDLALASPRDLSKIEEVLFWLCS